MSDRIRARSDGARAPVWTAVSLAWVLLASCASTDDGAIVLPPADDQHGLPSTIVYTSRGPESEAPVRVGGVLLPKGLELPVGQLEHRVVSRDLHDLLEVGDRTSVPALARI